MKVKTTMNDVFACCMMQAATIIVMAYVVIIVPCAIKYNAAGISSYQNVTLHIDKFEQYFDSYRCNCSEKTGIQCRSLMNRNTTGGYYNCVERLALHCCIGSECNYMLDDYLCNAHLVNDYKVNYTLRSGFNGVVQCRDIGFGTDLYGSVYPPIDATLLLPIRTSLAGSQFPYVCGLSDVGPGALMIVMISASATLLIYIAMGITVCCVFMYLQLRQLKIK